MYIRFLKHGEKVIKHDIYISADCEDARETGDYGYILKNTDRFHYLRIEPTSETEEARGMQSGPAAQAISDSPHALNGVVPDCLSGLMSALRTYAKDVTGTFETSFDGEKKLKINMEIFFK
jgi:hypothetical protein